MPTPPTTLMLASLARLPVFATCTLIVTFSGACARVPVKGGLAAVNATLGTRTELTASWIQGSAEDSVAAAYATRRLTGEVPVDTAIRIALLRNKRLQATFEDLGVAQADVVQAGLLASPTFAGGLFGAVGGGMGIRQFGLALPFIDYLQRSGRRAAAASRFAGEQARVASAVLMLVADVRVAYVDAQATEQMEELRASVLQATEASAIAAGALHAAGNLADYDLAQEQALAADARLAYFTAIGERRAARAELTRVLGVPLDSTWAITPRLAMPGDSLPPAETLAVLARTRRLDLRAAFHDVEAAGRTAGVTRAFALLPEGTIGVARESDPDGRFTGGTVSVPLPFFDQGQGRVARTRAEFRHAVNRHDALAVEVAAEAYRLSVRLAASRARAEHLQRSVLPLRRRVVVESQRFVNAMEHSVFTLLIAKQAEIDAGQAFVEALRDYWTARARLEQAVGGSFAPLTEAEQGMSRTSRTRNER